MAKSVFTDEDDAILSDLGIEIETKIQQELSPKQARIVNGFEEITAFYEKNARLPQNYSDNDIFERIYAVRLEQIIKDQENFDLLQSYDKHKIFEMFEDKDSFEDAEIDDDELLDALGLSMPEENSLTNLKHVKSRVDLKPAQEVAKYEVCENFEEFKPLFDRVNRELQEGKRKALEYKNNGKIEEGEFYILSGIYLYIHHVGEKIMAANGKREDARIHVIYANGTEIKILRRSLQRALNKDSQGRRGLRITRPDAGALFDEKSLVKQDGNAEYLETGFIYVLRSCSEISKIKENRTMIHKIGVTGGDIKKRIANAKNDPTFMLADVEIVASYQLQNIDRVKFENLLHSLFKSAQLDIQIEDRFGKTVSPREWFLVSLEVIDQAIGLINDSLQEGVAFNYRYNVSTGKLE